MPLRNWAETRVSGLRLVSRYPQTMRRYLIDNIFQQIGVVPSNAPPCIALLGTRSPQINANSLSSCNNRQLHPFGFREKIIYITELSVPFIALYDLCIEYLLYTGLLNNILFWPLNEMIIHFAKYTWLYFWIILSQYCGHQSYRKGEFNMASSGGTSASSSSGGGASPEVDGAISKYQTSQKKSSVESLTTATKVTEINGIYNAIKKISPA